MSSIPQNKAELIEAIQKNYAALKKELLLIPKERSDSKELEAHFKNHLMSVKDLLAYLQGWGQLVLKWNQHKSQGIPVEFPETGFKWNELGRLAQKFYKDYENKPYDSLLSALDETVNEILILIDSKSNEELYEMQWYHQWTLGRMIQLNTASAFKNARNRLRKWKKQI